MQQLAVKREIFKPLYLNFPFLDRLPIPSRIAARAAVHKFAANLVAEITKVHGTKGGNSSEKDTKDASNITVGSALAIAKEKGELTEQQFRDNAVIVFVAGHENPQLLITSLLYLLAKNKVCEIKLFQSYQQSMLTKFRKCNKISEKKLPTWKLKPA